MADPVSGLFSLAGNIAGNIAGGKDRGHAQDLLDQAIAAYKNVNVPTNLSDLINYQQYQNAGQLTPAQEQAINAAPSQQGQVKADPKLLAAQMQALSALQGVSQTGMSSTDRARLNQIQQQMATQAEGQKQQVMQNFQQRGLGGSGNELLAQLQAGQNASNQANQQGLGAASQAQQAALQALNAYGQQAGGLEQQQFGQQSQAAQANDLTNRFNVQNQMAQQARNVAQQNAAKQYNLQNQQGLMNANTGLSNTALNQQRAGEQQTFADQMQKAAGMSGADFQGSNAYNQMGAQQAQNWSNVGQGLGNIYGGLGGASGISSGLSSMFGGSGGGGGGAVQGPGSYAPTASGGGNNYVEGGGGGSGGAEGQFSTGEMVAAHGGTVPCYAMGGSTYSSSGSEAYPYGGGAQTYAEGGSVGAGVGTGPGRNSVSDYNPLLGPAIPQYANGGHVMSLPMLAMLAAKGGHVPGQAPVPGDSYANDKVHAVLSPGEIVIPRSISMHPNAPEMSKLFVENEMRKHGRIK